MMESYEEARINNSHRDDAIEPHEVKIHESALAVDCAALVGSSKQNFDFGAEITEKQIVTAICEEGIKTNGENITTTATVATMSMATPTSTLSKEFETVNDIEMPLNVAELPLSGVESRREQQQETSAAFEVEGNGDIDNNRDNDADSYDSDENDDEDDDIEGNENSEATCSHNRNNDISQEDSDESTSDSDFSDLSGLSDMSGREWKPINTRPINWVQKQIHAGANPRALLSQMLPSNAHQIAPGVNDMMLWRILASMLSEPPRRQKLRYINTFEDVIQLVQQSQKIMVLTGAGVSVSCGIPDFRSSDGIYSRLAKDFPNLPDPQAMFDINYFQRDPRPFYKFAREIYPGQFKPSPCHRFIRLLEQKEKLLRNYTQNIDTLEQVAGIRNVIECHGSFSTASCTKCKVKCTADAIRDDIFAQRIPVCRRCQPNVQQSVNASDPVSEMELRHIVENGIMKPDIVFFGEGLPEEFHTVMACDKDKCDLLIVIGSSLKVRPVALIPSSIPANVPQILINREQLHHLEFDVELLGDSDVIINQLCHRLGDDWKEICFDDVVLSESKELQSLEEDVTEGDEDANQLLDTDTQSVKSSASTDIALRSAGTYSDSGFESSTSSGMVVGKTIAAANEANEAIEKIKTTILELNSPTKKTKSSDLTSPEYLGEPTDAVDYDNRSFHSFTSRIGAETTSYKVNSRHLSVDSSKDSGIQCDTSNSATLTSSSGLLAPPVMKYGDSGGTSELTGCIIDITTASINSTTISANRVSTSGDTTSNITETENEVTIIKKSSSATRQINRKHLSAADRLFEGTYYCHESSASYVFPGAQVSWWSDSEGEDDEDNGHIYGGEEDDADINGAPLSPIMPPSVEAEVVSEISTTSAFAICAKRPMSIINNDVVSVAASSNRKETNSPARTAETENFANKCNGDIAQSPKRNGSTDTGAIKPADATKPPPQKRKRFSKDNCAAEAIELSSLSETTINCSNIVRANNSTTSNERFQTASTALINETLLQQF